MLHSWLSLVRTFRAATIIWEQQCRSKKLEPATQTQSLLLNYNRNRWLLSKLLGTWRSNRLSSRPDLWSSVCFVFSWSQVFLLHTDPCSARQNHRHRRWTAARRREYGIVQIKMPWPSSFSSGGRWCLVLSTVQNPKMLNLHNIKTEKNSEMLEAGEHLEFLVWLIIETVDSFSVNCQIVIVILLPWQMCVLSLLYYHI